jgi:hypothetical protein
MDSFSVVFSVSSLVNTTGNRTALGPQKYENKGI